MNRYTFLGLAAGLLVGALVGYRAGARSAELRAGPVVSPPPAAAFPPMGQPQAPVPGNAANLQALQEIPMLEQLVARDPKNRDAWVRLGNHYFDTQQPQKSIEAYDRALELGPGDPNVLTDQGIMFRAIGQFDRAVANFTRANQADPKHVQSLFNMGVVYLHDLRDPAKARDAWQKVIATAPNTPQAQQARDGLREIESAPPPARK